mmetsp:Transcript_31977/g.56526  ORF Transcript_31977/g.56526 Transcript_31977/m.56526 type:complete len:372 (-) Transcript_31977:52-1167(-)
MGAKQPCGRRNKQPPEAESADEEVARWSSDDTLELCAEGQESIFTGKVQLLDNTVASSTKSAVQKLNSGEIQCQEGFCVVHSITRGVYYLLFQEGLKQEALDSLAVSEAELEIQARERRAAARGQYLIVLDRTNGARLGIDVQPEGDRALVVEMIADGLVSEWNKGNPEKQVKPGDRIVEVNHAHGHVEDLVGECQRNQKLVVVLQPGPPIPRPARPSKGDAAASSATAEASVTTAPVPQGDPPVVEGASEVRLPVHTVDQSTETTPLEPVSQPVVEEYNITLDRTSGDMLGVDVIQSEHPSEAVMVIEGIRGGLVAKWNEEHPDAVVSVGDRIIAVSGVRGNLEAMIEQCKKEEMLELTLVKGTPIPKKS